MLLYIAQLQTAQTPSVVSGVAEDIIEDQESPLQETPFSVEEDSGLAKSQCSSLQGMAGKVIIVCHPVSLFQRYCNASSDLYKRGRLKGNEVTA